MIRTTALLLALTLLLPSTVRALPTAAEMISLTVKRDKQLQKRRKVYDYNLTITREKLDGDAKVTSTDSSHVVVHGDRRPDYDTRGALGKPDDEAKKASQEEPFELLDIIDHFTYKLEGQETIAGVPCYRIGFTPKPGMTARNREEKVLNAVGGHIWTSVADYSLIRDEGSLLHPVSVAWVFATLTQMEFHFDAGQLPNGDYGPRQVQYRYRVEIPLFLLHERDTRQMSNYRLSAR